MQNKSVNRLISLLVLISFTFAVSCTTTKVHPIHTTLPQEKVKGIKVGDTVKVTTYSGEKYKFKVEDISNEKIEGEGNTIALTDVESIQKVRFTGKKVAAAVGIIAFFVFLVWLGSNSKSSGDDRYVVGASSK